jgi:hypothetical protein
MESGKEKGGRILYTLGILEYPQVETSLASSYMAQRGPTTTYTSEARVWWKCWIHGRGAVAAIIIAAAGASLQ